MSVINSRVNKCQVMKCLYTQNITSVPALQFEGGTLRISTVLQVMNCDEQGFENRFFLLQEIRGAK